MQNPYGPYMYNTISLTLSEIITVKRKNDSPQITFLKQGKKLVIINCVSREQLEVQDFIKVILATIIRQIK